MKIIIKSLFVIAGALLVSMQASADVSFNSARVTSLDPLATADFYMTAFVMQEVQRINMPGGNVEIMLNFGSTQEAAKANTNAQVVIMHRDASETIDQIAHLIFNVTDIDATVTAAKKAGGTVAREPFEYGNTGIKIAMLADPAGNQIELLQQP